MKKLNIFKATIVAFNPCYIETVLVIDDSEEKAHKLLCTTKKRKVQYKKELELLSIDLTTPNVIEMVGWGENDSSGGDYDD
jgi:hypothetical protein